MAMYGALCTMYEHTHSGPDGQHSTNAAASLTAHHITLADSHRTAEDSSDPLVLLLFRASTFPSIGSRYNEQARAHNEDEHTARRLTARHIRTTLTGRGSEMSDLISAPRLSHHHHSHYCSRSTSHHPSTLPPLRDMCSSTQPTLTYLTLHVLHHCLSHS